MMTEARTASLTQFFGDICTEANHYRCDYFIAFENVLERFKDGRIAVGDEFLVASRDCGCEEWCIGMGDYCFRYHLDRYSTIYKCKRLPDSRVLCLSYEVEYHQITKEDAEKFLSEKYKISDEIVEMFK